ncbi:siderophore-interacting protein [Polaromonas sp. CG_9.11]|uniref:siderophore-interacting protein n=1 Tax=Polaromonas sp. CG_9.11 TaxID=2787730 RepID=UPI0018CAEB96|nr:siderophore-interacting protein [Polaromonas sp. CG_9.11]MBG6074617.1 NADPH-dependent ferric siderophore reductase [Polaromonas sp. CG_9.11]
MQAPSRAVSSPPAAAENAPRKRRPPRRVEVSRVQILSPAMRRITLTGTELQGFEAGDPASYLKLIFPEPGQTEPVRPLPDGPRATSMRTYTPRAVRPEAGEVDVDFVLHGEGPASTWAAQAETGQVLFLMGPGPGYQVDLQAVEHLLIGDASALPAFETILARLPATARVRVLVEVSDAAEERTLSSPAQLSARWVVRAADKQHAGLALEQALRQASAPAAQSRVYLACEAAAMRRIRELLTGELGLPRSQIIGRGYWKLGAVNHPDHDYGEDA